MALTTFQSLAVVPLVQKGYSVKDAKREQNEGIVVLLAEDEGFLRRSVARILKRHGVCTVIEVKNGLEGLKVLRSGDLEIDVVLSDVCMPELSGCDFHRIATKEGLLGPNGPEWIQMSGGMSEVDRSYLHQACILLLEKPMGFDELLQAVFEAVARRRKRISEK